MIELIQTIPPILSVERGGAPIASWLSHYFSRARRRGTTRATHSTLRGDLYSSPHHHHCPIDSNNINGYA